MGVPATTGNEKQHISEMEKNDYIKVQATSLDNWLVGDAVIAMEELSTNGVAWATSGEPFSKYFYLIKVDKGLLVADRIWQHTVSWDTLNANFLIEGRAIEIDGVQGQLRSPTGGISWMDENGNSSMTANDNPSYPNNNEYDKYNILNYNSDNLTWCKETPKLGTITSKTGQTASAPATTRTLRGKFNFSNWGYVTTGTTSTTVSPSGYRPVFEYNENNL